MGPPCSRVMGPDRGLPFHYSNDPNPDKRIPPSCEFQKTAPAKMCASTTGSGRPPDFENRDGAFLTSPAGVFGTTKPRARNGNARGPKTANPFFNLGKPPKPAP
ncbi:MAG: hypothetical protein CM15mP84_00100 [Cellvibrionales bacterium]|nr:MAG: hypothetical protein CM15mP84_00100 [Cellvibrionales bacterium]